VIGFALLVPYSGRFEIDIIFALSSQLVNALEKLEIGSLTEIEISSLETGQGVYQLFYGKALVYVGQARSLRKRLAEHYGKISGRKNIDVSEMGFKCVFVHPNWTALAPEDALIKHHRKLGKGNCPWNGNGFGPHDPGRQRETTNKTPEGFDANYPIKEDWPCSWIKAGEYTAEALLRSLKRGLPYLLRFETAEPKSSKPHPDCISANVDVPSDGMPANELLRQVAMSLPGWQATIFPGHMILYKEQQAYRHGKVIWPLP
jgi:hypothetical protein